MTEIEVENEQMTTWQLAKEIAWDSAEWMGQMGGFKSLVISPLSVLGRIAPTLFPAVGHANGTRKLISGAEAFSKFTKISSPESDLSYVVLTEENKYQARKVSYDSWAPATEAVQTSDWLSSTCSLMNCVRSHHLVDWCKTLFSGVVALDGVARTSYFLYCLYSQSEKVAWQSVVSSVMKIALSILHMGLVAHRIAELVLPAIPALANQLEFWTVVTVAVLSPIAHHYWDKFAVQPLYEKKKRTISS